MSRTKRIYNNPRLNKTQRYNVDDVEDADPFFRTHTKRQVGIPLTKKSWICMGRCPMCRDVNREPWLIRKRNKEEFRNEMKMYSVDLKIGFQG